MNKSRHPYRTYAKAHGYCLHPRCHSRAMTSAHESAIRCAAHKDLCSHCWKRKYVPELGYCKQCYAEMIANLPRYSQPTAPLPEPDGKPLVLDDIDGYTG